MTKKNIVVTAEEIKTQEDFNQAMVNPDVVLSLDSETTIGTTDGKPAFGPEAAVIEPTKEEEMKKSFLGYVRTGIGAGPKFLSSVFSKPATDETAVAGTNTKEESTMTKAVDTVKGFDYKKAASNTWAFIKDMGTGIVSFTKKHLAKASLGLTTLTVAGTFTTGMGAALVAGTVLYAAVAAAIAFIKAKKEKGAESRNEIILNALGESLLYGTLGALSMMFVVQAAVVALAASFVYSYVGMSYMTYFIVA